MDDPTLMRARPEGLRSSRSSWRKCRRLHPRRSATDPDRVAALETQVARIEATLGEMAQSVAKLVNGVAHDAS